MTCTVCGKSFATKLIFHEHQRMAHALNPSNWNQPGWSVPVKLSGKTKQQIVKAVEERIGQQNFVVTETQQRAKILYNRAAEMLGRATTQAMKDELNKMIAELERNI